MASKRSSRRRESNTNLSSQDSTQVETGPLVKRRRIIKIDFSKEDYELDQMQLQEFGLISKRKSRLDGIPNWQTIVDQGFVEYHNHYNVSSKDINFPSNDVIASYFHQKLFQFSNLKVLVIQFPINPVTIRPLFRTVLPNLELLYLEQPEPHGSTIFTVDLRQLPQTSPKFCHLSLSGFAINQIPNFKLPSLSSFELNLKSFDAKYDPFCLEALNPSFGVTSLDLSRCMIDFTNHTKMVDIVAQNTKLQVLNLSNNPVFVTDTIKALDQWAERLLQNNTLLNLVLNPPNLHGVPPRLLKIEQLLATNRKETLRLSNLTLPPPKPLKLIPNDPMDTWLQQDAIEMEASPMDYQDSIISTDNESIPVQKVDMWEQRLQELKQWLEENPDRWPKNSSKIEAEKKLAQWLSNQKRYYKTLQEGKKTSGLASFTQERIDKLDATIPGWKEPAKPVEKVKKESDEEDPWVTSLEAVAKFKTEHHRFPKSSTLDPVEKKLNAWLVYQRKQWKLYAVKKQSRLTPQRAEMLETRLSGWNDEEEDPWYETLFELVEWREKHEGRWPTTTERDLEERKLGNWLIRQRQQLKSVKEGKKTARLSDARLEKINELCPGWDHVDQTEERWQAGLKELVEWREEFNRWPRQFGRDLGPGERKNGMWLAFQRKRKRVMDGDEGDVVKNPPLTLEQIQQLDEACPGWEGVEKPLSLQEKVDMLKFWRAHHPESWPSMRGKEENEKILGKWLYEMRKAHAKNSLSEELRRVLEENFEGWEKEEIRHIGTEQSFMQSHIERFRQDQFQHLDIVEPDQIVPINSQEMSMPKTELEILKWPEVEREEIGNQILMNSYAYTTMAQALLMPVVLFDKPEVTPMRQVVQDSLIQGQAIPPPLENDNVFLMPSTFDYAEDEDLNDGPFGEKVQERVGQDLERFDHQDWGWTPEEPSTLFELPLVSQGMIPKINGLERIPLVAQQHVLPMGIFGPNHSPLNTRMFHMETAFVANRLNQYLPHGVMQYALMRRDVVLPEPPQVRLHALPGDAITPDELLLSRLWKRTGVMNMFFLDQREGRPREAWLRRLEQESIPGRTDVLSQFTLYSPYRYRVHAHVEMDWKIAKEMLQRRGIYPNRPKWFTRGMTPEQWKETEKKENLMDEIFSLPKRVPVCVVQRLDRALDVAPGHDAFVLPLIYHSQTMEFSEIENIDYDLWAPPRESFSSEETWMNYIEEHQEKYTRKCPVLKQSFTFHLDLSDKNPRGKVLRAWFKQQTDQRGRFPPKIFIVHFMLVPPGKVPDKFEGRYDWNMVQHWDAETMGSFDIAVKTWGGQSITEAERRQERSWVTFDEFPACRDCTCPGRDVDGRVVVI